MKAYQYAKGTGIDSLRLAEISVPNPGPGQVLIRVHAVSLNYKDLFVANGMPPRRPGTPLIPTSDGAGEIVAVGEGVTRVEVGDRVASIVAPRWITGGLTEQVAELILGSTVDGVLAEYVALEQEAVVKIPPHLTWEEAATLPCAGATAWNTLARQSGVKAGETVLVQGSGGVAIFALQFAKLLGARVIGTSSSDEKLQRMRELGAFAEINYKKVPHWEEDVLRLTGGIGVDHIVEVGGGGTLEKSFRAVRTGGTICFVGVLAGLEQTVDPLPVLAKGLRLQGVSVGPRDAFEEMNRAIGERALRPVLSRIFPFEEAREALHFLESGAHFGKIVVQISGNP